MPTHRHEFFRLLLLAAIVVTVAVTTARAQSTTDPRLTTWQFARSGAYARVWETNADKSSNNAVATWPRAGLANRGGGQSTPTYSDVSRVTYSANYVYVYTTGLASYTMGPWYDTNGTTLFGMWPANRGAIHQIPRNPVIPATKSITRGVGGVLVNGVYLWNNGDAQSYTTSTGQVSFNGQGIWNRLAGPTEGPTFDSGNAHQPQNGQYHNHINPRALRYQLGDAVTYNEATKTYVEGTPTKHSPIIGWANDGLPIYGPYGYANPASASSGVRRMTSGFAKRDGTNGTTNLAVTGRATLPAWAASVQNRSATLSANQYGPSTTATAIGTFAEDYEYLGDLGKVQGTDFDLNRQNVRFCVTPEFPAGTYAYFTCIDASGNSVFPDVIGQEFFGTPASFQGVVNNVTESVTVYARGGQASAITVTATAVASGVMVSWGSVEGGTYSVATSSDGTTFTALATSVTSGGTTTTYTTATVAAYYRVTLVAVASYDTAGGGGVSGVGTAATAAYEATPPVGTSGTARLVNLATRAQVGGSAGTPIAGFVLSGSGTRKMLMRAVGPGLGALGVGGVLADPALSLVSGSTTVASNDNWAAADSTTITATGAFGLTVGSKDAAIVVTLNSGAYSGVVGAAGGSGVALLELYDAESSTASTLNIVNASTRAYVGTGEQILIPGFVVSGSGSVKLLIRAAGPALTGVGVGGALADPQLTLYSGASVVATNDNWGGASNFAEIKAAANSNGAFTFADSSKDAALLVTLPAGAYTASVSGVGGTTGTALVEIYVVQ